MRTKTPHLANHEFVVNCLAIDDLLAQLAAARAEHFGADPEEDRNWGEVGGVIRLREALEQALASVARVAP